MLYIIFALVEDVPKNTYFVVFDCLEAVRDLLNASSSKHDRVFRNLNTKNFVSFQKVTHEYFQLCVDFQSTYKLNF